MATDERPSSEEQHGAAGSAGLNGTHVAGTAVNGHHPPPDAEPDAVQPAAGTRRRHGWFRRGSAWDRDSNSEDSPRSFAAVVISRTDDLASVFGKISAADSPRVALMAPRGNRDLATQLGMRRLQRHLDLSGRDLMLVTRSRVLRLRAREEGLPNVTSIKRVNFERRGSGLHLGWMTLRLPTLGALLAVAVFVAAVALGLAVLFWYVPSSTVTVLVPVETIGDTVQLIADTKATEVNVARGVVPARRRDLIVTRTFPGPATGTSLVPQDHAGVGLVFSNRTNRAITVPKGTIIHGTTGMQFTLASDVALQARIGATGEAIALAQRPGTAGNVPRNTTTRIDGPLNNDVAVTNPNPGERGSEVRQTVVSDNDVLFLRSLADAYLADAARKEFVARYAQSETVFADGATIEVTDCTPVPAIGQAARYVEVTCTARATSLTVRDDDLRTVYVDRFSKKIGPDRMLMEGAFKTTVDLPGQHDATFDRLTVAVRVTDLVAPYVDRAQLRDELRGKSRTGAEATVRELVNTPLEPEIKLAGWAHWLPKQRSRITIIVKPAP